MSAGAAFPAAAHRRRLLDLLARPPAEAARRLLGTLIVRREGNDVRVARIVETEAYLGQDDPSAHAFRGRTPRNAPLWGPPGTIYVYFIYGMHYCLNFAVERAGTAGCVLIRAAEPLAGLAPGAATGPGRLCRALAIDTALSGGHLFDPSRALYLREGWAPRRIGVTTRVGIRQAADWPLRFFDADSAAVSFPRGPATYSLAPAGR
ncbi:MAG TPA: DNA-3-methyladenine glycosylase [Vicinamibacteria bacterium]|jgi:DNA-3-methyladenine glycosylase